MVSKASPTFLLDAKKVIFLVKTAHNKDFSDQKTHRHNKIIQLLVNLSIFLKKKHQYLP